MGPRIEPWGTPQCGGAWDEVDSPMWTEKYVAQVGLKTIQGAAWNAHTLLQPVDEDSMVNGVKCCQVQEDEDGGVADISSHEKVVYNAKEGSLRTMEGTEAWLKFFEKVVSTQESDQLRENNLLEDLRQERSFRDRSVAAQRGGV